MPKMIKPAPVAATPKKNARIVVVLDRSGSMISIKSDTIGGYNTFVESQKKVDGKVRFTLAQFDNIYETVYDNVPIADVPLMTDAAFLPRGATALYDAVGKSVANAMAQPELDDEQTIVVIITDGGENASSEHNWLTVQTLMKEVQDERKWQVMFIAANMDAKSVSNTMGIKSANSFTYAATGKGVTDAFTTASMTSSAYRGTIGKGVTMNAAGDVDTALLYSSIAAEGKSMSFQATAPSINATAAVASGVFMNPADLQSWTTTIGGVSPVVDPEAINEEDVDGVQEK